MGPKRKERTGVEGQKEPPKGEKRSENGDGRVPRKENGVRVTPKGRREPEEWEEPNGGVGTPRRGWRSPRRDKKGSKGRRMGLEKP